MSKRKPDPYRDPSMRLHKVWHKFTDMLEDNDRYTKPAQVFSHFKTFKNGKTKTITRYGRELDFTKLVGYELMCEVRKYMQKNKEIQMVAVDDDHHAGSQLLLIPHERKDYFMGTTVMFIPQCTSTQNTFFLYTDALDELIKKLQEIQKRQDLDPFWSKVKKMQKKFDKMTPAQKKADMKRIMSKIKKGKSK